MFEVALFWGFLKGRTKWSRPCVGSLNIKHPPQGSNSIFQHTPSIVQHLGKFVELNQPPKKPNKSTTETRNPGSPLRLESDRQAPWLPHIEPGELLSAVLQTYLSSMFPGFVTLNQSSSIPCLILQWFSRSFYIPFCLGSCPSSFLKHQKKFQ